MKRLLLLFLAILTLTTISQPAGASPNDFTFTSFDGDYRLGKDSEGRSTLAVTERLTAEFPAINQNHGIERAIPDDYDSHPLDLKITAVTNPSGAALPYSTYSSNGNTVIRVGSANSFVHGTNKYVISYTMRDVTITKNGKQEFFWNVNGTQWQQPFGSVSARIHLDPSIAGAFDQRTICFTGSQGSTAKNCQINTLEANQGILATTTMPLQPTENLSVAIGFAPGTFTSFVPTPIPVWVLILLGLAIIVIIATQIIAPIWLLRYAYRTWKLHGKDTPGRGTIIPEYAKPAERSMLENSIALKEAITPTAVSALFIDLAIRGYLTLTDQGKNGGEHSFILTIIKPVDDLTTPEKEALQLLFGSLSVGTTASTKTYREGASGGIARIQATLYQDMLARGFFIDTSREAAKLKKWGAIFIVGAFFVLGIVPFIAGVIALVFASKMPARSGSGVALRDHLLGNKLYMQIAEADRIHTLQSVEGAERIDTTDGTQIIKLYEKLLPLAMLFGIEKEWAQQFETIISDYQPGWYASSNGSLFTAAALGSSLNGLGATLTNSTFAPPATSSSSSSGFSGGSSGGGGGGGGGGGW